MLTAKKRFSTIIETIDLRFSLDKKELVALISLDLSKALDCVPHELLLAKCRLLWVMIIKVTKWVILVSVIFCGCCDWLK